MKFYIGETGRNLKQRRHEHDRAIRLGKVTQSAIACHCLQSGHKFDFDGIRALDTRSNKRHRLIVAAWYMTSREGGLTGEMMDIPTQYTSLMQMEKLDGATSWIRRRLGLYSVQSLVLPKQSPWLLGTILDGPPLRHSIPACWYSLC